MFVKCLNPECRAQFDHREGRLIRFCKPPLNGQNTAGQSRVEHFWLCGTCSNRYVFEYKRGEGMGITLRVKELQEKPPLSFASTA